MYILTMLQKLGLTSLRFVHCGTPYSVGSSLVDVKIRTINNVFLHREK